jgi:hypothetical protein
MVTSSNGVRVAALEEAVPAYMEVIASERTGGGPAIAAESLRIIEHALQSAAHTERERDDLFAQIQILAETALDENWPEVQAFIAETGEVPLFRGPRMMPTHDTPLHPMPAVTKASPSGQPRLIDVVSSHLVAHAYVGSMLTGLPISVGFGGVSLPGPKKATVDHRVQMLAAGASCDTQLCGAPVSHGCGCSEIATRVVFEALGIPEDDFDGTVGERARSLGCEQQYLDYFKAQFNIAAALVEHGLASGEIVTYAQQLQKLGRIVVSLPPGRRSD